MKKALLSLLYFISLGIFAQVSSTIPSPQIKCDINNPGDMIEVFNLRDSEAEIITGQTNVEVTYHLTSGDALGNGGFIANPETYENVSPEQIIFVRVQNVSNASDFQITIMEIIVRQPPTPLTEDPEPLTVEDADGSGFGIFDLTVIVNQLYTDSFAQEVTYYESEQEAETQTNPIANPENYTNLTNPQEVFAVAQNAPESACVKITSFQLVVQESLSLQENDKDIVQIFPNPAQDYLTVTGSVEIKEATIYSVSGQLFKTVRSPRNNDMTVNVSTLPSGIYFIQTTTGATSKFIKQ